MRFWDSSAVVPLLVHEPRSTELRALAEDGVPCIVWWGTAVEVASAVSRREREGSLSTSDAGISLETYAELTSWWGEIPPTAVVRDGAVRAVRRHALRAADALQLAAAQAASSDQPATLPFVTLDERLALAASREGFPIVPVTAGG